MVISPISSVSYRNNVYFASKHKKQSNPAIRKLAVPAAATILAIAPMKTSANYNFDVEDANRVEIVDHMRVIEDVAEIQQRKIVQRGTIKDASPIYGDAIMELISDNGGETGYMQLTFKNVSRYKGHITENGKKVSVPIKDKITRAIEVDTLKTVNTCVKDNSTKEEVGHFSKYYVSGPGKIFSVRYVDDESNKILKDYESKIPNMDIEITEELYENLKGFLGDQVQYKTEERIKTGVY